MAMTAKGRKKIAGANLKQLNKLAGIKTKKASTKKRKK